MGSDPVWGLVLAGGESRRMGRDKALLMRGAQTQLSFAVGLLRPLLERVFVSARADQLADPERKRFDVIVDRYADLGPIAGILSAMDRNPDVSWLVVACDLPNLDRETIRNLLGNRAVSQPFTAYKSTHDGLPEPLCAIYTPQARPIIDAFVTEGIVCPRKMLIKSDTLLLQQPDPAALDNVNTPEDLQRNRAGIAS